MSEKTTTRVQMELPPQSIERLKKLREDTEAASYAEVLKNALRLYEALVEESRAGNKVMVESKSGDRVEYRMVF